jgi:hypothetical protein
MPQEADAPRRRPQGALLPRIGRAWRSLEPEGRLAAAASVALFVTMFLPWYQQNVVTRSGKSSPLVSQDLSAFGVFSFVEAAVLLVAIAVLVLLFARAERRAFHLPGGDGTIVMIAGGWVALLLVWRLFDKPGITKASGAAGNVGIQWGIFFALGAAGMLTYAGTRMRALARPEPPLVTEPRTRRPAARRPAGPPGGRAPHRPPAPGTEVTRVLPPPASAPVGDEPPTQRLPDER